MTQPYGQAGQGLTKAELLEIAALKTQGRIYHLYTNYIVPDNPGLAKKLYMDSKTTFKAWEKFLYLPSYLKNIH